jgi:hypothetical protein
MMDTSDNGYAEGFSIWLLPPDAARSTFVNLIRELSERFATPLFEPHITLAGGLSGGNDLLPKARLVAARISAIPIRFMDPACAESFFQSVFLPVVPSERLSSANLAIADIYGLLVNRSYNPHLSLVYGLLPAATKQEIVNRIAQTSIPAFVAGTLQVQETNGTTDRWRPLLTCSLRA